jgi:hypothetical protein
MPRRQPFARSKEGNFMRTTILLAALTLCGGCVDLADLTGSRQAEEHAVASCRRWDEMAQNAAHPDAATIAFHDRLAQKAADLKAAAVGLHGAALDAAIGAIARAEIEANAVYDAADKRRIANECWAELGVMRQIHGEMARDLMRTVNEPSPNPPTDAMRGAVRVDRSGPAFQAPPAPPPALSSPPDLYAVQHGAVTLFSPDGPRIGETSRIGGPAPSVVLVPAPPAGLFSGTDTTP